MEIKSIYELPKEETFKFFFCTNTEENDPMDNNGYHYGYLITSKNNAIQTKIPTTLYKLIPPNLKRSSHHGYHRFRINKYGDIITNNNK